MIDMDAYVIERVKSATARFQRNSDGQFVGRLSIDENEFECWLVFDDPGPEVKHPAFRKAHGAPMEDPAFLKLSFENPYTSAKEVSGQ
jgi:hypothetical protein